MMEPDEGKRPQIDRKPTPGGPCTPELDEVYPDED